MTGAPNELCKSKRWVPLLLCRWCSGLWDSVEERNCDGTAPTLSWCIPALQVVFCLGFEGWALTSRGVLKEACGACRPLLHINWYSCFTEVMVLVVFYLIGIEHDIYVRSSWLLPMCSYCVTYAKCWSPTAAENYSYGGLWLTPAKEAVDLKDPWVRKGEQFPKKL